MTEASEASSVALETVVYIAKSIWSVQWGWYLARILRLIALPLSLVTVPLSYVARVLLVVFAPLIYLLGFLANSAQGVLSLLISLQPLYSFLSAAAGIGIIAGLVLGATSSVLTSFLGIQNTDDEPSDPDRTDDDYYEDEDEKDYGYNFDSPALDSSPYRKYLWGSDAETGPKRRKARGLLSQTIHEEDDSSGE